MGNKRTKSLEYFNIDNKNPNKPLLDKKCNILFAKRTALSSSYKITGVLGSGSNGKVYECECLFTKKKFALKVYYFLNNHCFFLIKIVLLIRN